MPWYKCFIHGEYFPGELLGESNPVGFYTTRFVEAVDPSEAEKLALENLRKEPAMQLPPGVTPSRRAKVYFEEICEVCNSEVSDIQAGFSWYVEGT